MKNKGKPSGKFAEKKTKPGAKSDYKRGGWPEDAATQRMEGSRGRLAEQSDVDAREGRNRKAGAPTD